MRSFHKGFSLVEIMVGLAMGMIAMVVIMQVFKDFEGGKRATTGGADAQSNGAIALFMIERAARMGGWGMLPTAYESCDTSFTYCDGSATCGGSEGSLGLSFAPVRITDGGDKPDSITVQFYAQPNQASYRFPANTSLRKNKPQFSSEFEVSTVAGCEIGGMALVSQGGQCTLVKITHVQAQAGKVQHNGGKSGEFNPPANYQKEKNWPGYDSGATVACFKPPANGAVYRRHYAVDVTTRQLQLSDNTVNPVVTNGLVASDILDIQAQYGIAATGSQVVDDWVDAADATWSNPTTTNIKRIKAIRIALVARSPQYEKPVDGVCTTTTTDMVKAWSTWAKFETKAASYPADWQCYRYKVFESVVPLRNIVWANL